MRKIYYLVLLAHSIFCQTLSAQEEQLYNINVSGFSYEAHPQYADIIKGEILEVLAKSRNINITTDITGSIAHDKQRAIIGNISSIKIDTIKNSEGRIKGYKGFVNFTIETKKTSNINHTEINEFCGTNNKSMSSPESALTRMMKSMNKELDKYFKKSLAPSGMVTKIIKEDNEKAQNVLINIGKKHGVSVGDKIYVQYISMKNGKPFPNDIGSIKVVSQSGDSYSECKVPSRIGRTIKNRMNAYCKLSCFLLKK